MKLRSPGASPLLQLPVAERKLFTWPWSSWNELLDPAESGSLSVIAGPDGVGKTAYAECIAEHWARQGHHVAFVHFELSKIIMLDRRACRHTSIARRTLKYANELTPVELRTLEAASRPPATMARRDHLSAHAGQDD